MRRQPLLSLLLFAVLARTLPAAEPAARPPNILPIYAEDIGYGDFGCHGATRVKTPHVDRLAL